MLCGNWEGLDVDVSVDWAGLERRRRRLPKRLHGDAMDVVIQGEVGGVPSSALVERVRQLIAGSGLVGPRVNSKVEAPVPSNAVMTVTTEGVAVWVGAPWRLHLEQLVDVLQSSPLLKDLVGEGGRLTVSPQVAYFQQEGMQHLGTQPTLALVLPIKPTLADGPRNDIGVPEFRWGVPDDVTRQVSDAAARFVFDPAWGAPTSEFIRLTAHGGVLARDYQAIRVFPSDASTALQDALPHLDCSTLVELWSSTHAPRNLAEAPDGHVSGVGFKEAGLTSWVHHGPSTTAEKIHRLLTLARGLGKHIQAAAIQPSMVMISGTNALDDWDTWFTRDAWSDQIPDLAPYLIVTQRHLDRAGTLEGWTVTPFTHDRWLLALDLEPDHLHRVTGSFRDFLGWRQNTHGYSPEYLTARDGLGDMIHQTR